jgi:hypothetical protein
MIAALAAKRAGAAFMRAADTASDEPVLKLNGQRFKLYLTALRFPAR